MPSRRGGRYRDRHTFKPPRAILCEGPSDEAFFRALIDAKSLPEFSIRNCADADETGKGGIDKFGKLLEAIPGFGSFYDLRDILIVADGDTNPQGNFERVVRQITQAAPEATPNPAYGVPRQHLEKAAGSPASIAVMILPWIDTPGNLESLCLKSAVAASPTMAACVDAFAACAEVGEWSDTTKADKMRLVSMISAQHQANPPIGFGRIWKDASGLVPLNHPCFDRVAAVLESYR